MNLKSELINIVLVETSHPGNIGSVARAMKTMGLSKLSLINPRKFPFLGFSTFIILWLAYFHFAKGCGSIFPTSSNHIFRKSILMHFHSFLSGK